MFIKIHPGGSVIQLAAGRDGTGLYESYHPGDSMPKIDAVLKSKTKYIGPLDNAPKPDDAFFKDVVYQVESHLKSLGLNRHSYQYWAYFEAALTIILYTIFMFCAVFYKSYVAAAITGLLTGRMGFLMHTGNHCGFSKESLPNRIIGLFMDYVGSSHFIWWHEHQVAHHITPNILGSDNDCEIGNPVIRLHPDLPRKWYHKFQVITLFMGISVGLYKWILSDLVFLLKGEVGNIRMTSIRDRDIWFNLIFKIWFAVVYVVIPTRLWGFGTAMSLLFVRQIFAAHYLENIFIVNHVQEGLIPSSPKLHWAVQQVAGTANWGSGSWLWNIFSGGLNHQIEHHLFPSMNTYLYPIISPVVAKVCKKHGLTYSNYNNFFSAWFDMVRNVNKLGNEDMPRKKVD